MGDSQLSNIRDIFGMPLSAVSEINHFGKFVVPIKRGAILKGLVCISSSIMRSGYNFLSNWQKCYYMRHCKWSQQDKQGHM